MVLTEEMKAQVNGMILRSVEEGWLVPSQIHETLDAMLLVLCMQFEITEEEDVVTIKRQMADHVVGVMTWLLMTKTEALH